MTRSVDVILEEIIRSIDWIEADTAGLEEQAFIGDRRIRQLVGRNLEIISEASRRIPAEFKGRHVQMRLRSAVVAMLTEQRGAAS